MDCLRKLGCGGEECLGDCENGIGIYFEKKHGDFEVDIGSKV